MEDEGWGREVDGGGERVWRMRGVEDEGWGREVDGGGERR